MRPRGPTNPVDEEAGEGLLDAAMQLVEFPSARRGRDALGPSSFRSAKGMALLWYVLLVIWSGVRVNVPPAIVPSVEPNMFDANAASTLLNDLANLGPRTVGAYANEVTLSLSFCKPMIHVHSYIQVKAVEILMKHLQNIEHNAEGWVQMEVELQRPSGSFVHTEFLGGFVNAYRNVTNIVVR